MIYNYSDELGDRYDETDSAEYVESTYISGREYEDPEFPANGRSLNFRGHTPLGYSWKRPYELAKDPVFIEDSATQYDVSQGALGDCWFMGAAAAMAATNRKLLMRVIMPVKQGFGSGYTGRFVFKFWQYDRWINVVIDDRLPTYGGRLVYARNRQNPREFWCPLLEKAFAKLYGCYEAIVGGRIHHAFVDMSGGISETIDIPEDKPQPEQLFTILHRTLKMNSLLGAAIFPSDKSATSEVERPNGLFEGHAYSITALEEVTDRHGRKHRLVRLRNPWGVKEWKGDWSDRSRLWDSVSAIDKNRLLLFQHDGEFWMPIEEVIRNVNAIDMAHLTPDALTNEVAVDMEKKIWEPKVYKDSWVRGVSAGGCGNPPNRDLYWMNPQFRLNIDPVTNGSTVVISLMEIMESRDADVNIGLDIYKLRPGQPERPLDKDYDGQALMLKRRADSYIPYRELTMRVELEPGKYVIIPSTFYPHKESGFLLRIFTEQKTESWPSNWPSNSTVNEEESLDLINKLFYRTVGSHRMADPENLRNILTEAKLESWGKSDGFTLETCRTLLVANDIQSREGEIDLHAVRTIWRDLNKWKTVFDAVADKKLNGVETYDLRDMYKELDINIGRDVLRSVARLFGGRKGEITFEDFAASVARILAMHRTFRQLRRDRSENTVTLDLDKWLETTLYL